MSVRVCAVWCVCGELYDVMCTLCVSVAIRTDSHCVCTCMIRIL